MRCRFLSSPTRRAQACRLSTAVHDGHREIHRKGRQSSCRFAKPIAQRLIRRTSQSFPETAVPTVQEAGQHAVASLHATKERRLSKAPCLFYARRLRNRRSLEMSEFQFFNPYDDIRFTVNRIPHWQQKGAVYFVTFRLADAVPQHLREQWESDREVWLRFHPSPWDAETDHAYHERFSGAIERRLDAGHGSCVLRRPHFAALVAEALVTLTATEFRKSRGW